MVIFLNFIQLYLWICESQVKLRKTTILARKYTGKIQENDHFSLQIPSKIKEMSILPRKSTGKIEENDHFNLQISSKIEENEHFALQNKNTFIDSKFCERKRLRWETTYNEKRPKVHHFPQSRSEKGDFYLNIPGIMR